MSLVITVVVVLPWLLSAATMRISTYNLRFDSQPDNITVQESLDALPDPLVQPSFLQFTREQPWSTRRMRVVEHLLGEGVVIAGFQEALVRQVNDLAQLFGDDYAWIGVGRDDGVAAGEFSPIFYSKEAVKLLSNDSFWLSNTPFEPSKFPGAGSFRVCTVARFQIIGPIDGRQMFTLLNTHLDDQSDDQRRLAASLLLTRARFEAVKTEAPVFITGDFNSPSTGQDSGAYGIITGTIPPVPINATFADKFAVKDDELPDFKMLDLREETPRRSVSANFATRHLRREQARVCRYGPWCGICCERSLCSDWAHNIWPLTGGRKRFCYERSVRPVWIRSCGDFRWILRVRSWNSKRRSCFREATNFVMIELDASHKVIEDFTAY